MTDTDNKTYRIEELATSGWELVDAKYQRMTKESTKEALQALINEGYNPGRLRAIPDGIAT